MLLLAFSLMRSREKGHWISFGVHEWKEGLAGGHSQNLDGFQALPAHRPPEKMVHGTNLFCLCIK